MDSRLIEARRLLKRLRPYLRHDASCAWCRLDADNCRCEYSKLRQRIDRLLAAPKKEENHE